MKAMIGTMQRVIDFSARSRIACFFAKDAEPRVTRVSASSYE